MTDESLSTITNSLPSLFDSMKVVWKISHYCDCDERLVPLLEQVVFQICAREKEDIKIKNILEQPSKNSMSILSEGYF